MPALIVEVWRAHSPTEILNLTEYLHDSATAKHPVRRLRISSGYVQQETMMNAPRILAVGLVAIAIGACSSTRTTVIDEPSTLEGVQPVSVKNIEAVYRKPGADFSQYRRLLIRIERSGIL